MMALEKARCPSSPAGAQRRSGESRRGRGGSETVRLKTVRKIEKARSGWARVRETETRFFPLWHRGAEMDLEVTDQNNKSCNASGEKQGINSPEETPSHLEVEAAIPQ